MAIMQVSRKVDYALRAAPYLAYQGDRRPCSVGEIAAQEGIPKKFLEKIIQDLIHHGLVRSTRGAQGGYALAKAAEQVTFKDVIEAVEGPISLNVCVGEHPECFLLGTCGMQRIWQEGQRRVLELFEKTTISSVRGPVRPAAPTLVEEVNSPVLGSSKRTVVGTRP